MSRLSRIESCKLCPRFLASLRCAVVNLFAYTFCKITLCGLHPARAPSFTARCALQALLRLLSLPRGKLPSQVSPKVPNVCGTIRQKFQVRHGRVRRLYDEFPPSRSLFRCAALQREGRRDARPTRLGPSVIRGEHA